MKLNHRLASIALVVSLVSGGCASKAGMPKSGFLNDYDNFEAVEGHPGLFVKRHTDADIGRYEKIMVAPVKIHFDAKSKKVTDEQLSAMTASLREGLIKGLGEKYAIVEAPGPGVLLVKTAITDVKANKIYLNLHWSTTLAGFGVGGAAIEAEFSDSETGEKILSVVTSQKGKRLKYFKGLSAWGHTNGVLEGWGAFLLDALKEAPVENTKE